MPKSFSTFTTNGVTWKIAEPLAPGGARRLVADVWGRGIEPAGKLLALTNNQNLAAAAAHMRQSRDLRARRVLEFYPQ